MMYIFSYFKIARKLLANNKQHPKLAKRKYVMWIAEHTVQRKLKLGTNKKLKT